jgi:16S rRNA processing protein RimM
MTNSKSNAQNQKSGNPKSDNSKSTNSKSSNTKSGNTKSGNTKSSNSKSSNSKSGNSKSEKVNIKLPDGWLDIGTIVAPHALQGEVRIYPNSDFPERFEVPGKRWLLRPGNSQPEEIEIKRGQFLDGKNLYLVKFAGIDNCNQASELRGCKLLVPESDRPTLSEDEYHVLDLLGLEVYIQESGEMLGKVVDIIPTGHDLLEVQLCDKSKTVLIPFVTAIVSVVDIQNQRVEVILPPGLLELNN